MAKFLVVNPKTEFKGEMVAVGTIIELDEVPASLVNKVSPLPEGQTLEVATPDKKAK